jgi:hypothetical protein
MSLLADHSWLDCVVGGNGLAGNKSCWLSVRLSRRSGRVYSLVLMEAMARRFVQVSCMLSVVEGLEEGGIDAA